MLKYHYINEYEKHRCIKQDRQNIILQMQQEKENNNNKEISKSLKNKYHSISNKVNHQENHEKLKEQKKIFNKNYQTVEAIENKRRYAKEYQRRMREIMKSYNIQVMI